jgi:D-alanyl-lipoteichoic acid acyltransferase DltB (MBOAT superfamily)
MLFNTFHFVIFFVLILGLHFALPQRYRWALLLAASCYFYMGFIPAYILVLGASIAIDYVAGIWIEDAPPARRKTLLGVSLVANIGLLAVFKYFNFLDQNVAALARLLGWNYGVHALGMVLPIGLSFHTFQAMSYTIEVYRGNQKAERHLGIYALYVMFFPQLVAGPIERPQNMLHQFREPHRLDAARWRSGLKQMLWGLFKKVAVADLVAPVVGTVYAAPTGYRGPVLIVATVFFAVQIYCDFSGYSDIAIGAARLLGYDLMTNFKQPYFARSISEFWRRWHISLSTWFRDYVYLPLGGNRVPTVRRYANLLIVFAVSGLWHGASWTFVVWGALHGVYLVMSQVLAPVRQAAATALGLARVPRLVAGLQTLWVFFLALIGWVFFRARTFGDALHVLTRSHDFTGFRIDDLFALGLPRFEMGVAFAMVATVMVVDGLLVQQPAPVITLWQRRPVRWAALAACFYGVVFFGVFEKVQFIYFQF